MSLSADPTPSADPAALPADPSAYRRRSGDVRLLGPFYWGLMIGIVICVLAGIAVARFLPSVLAAKPAAVAPASDLQAELSAPSTAPSAGSAAALAEPAAPLSASATAAPPAQVAALSSRLDRIEAGQKHTVAAAGAALATASLVQAAQMSRPFSGELNAVAALTPETPDIAALRRISLSGAPTRAGLAATYADAAARASAAASGPQGDGLSARIARALAAVVTVRRVDHVKGNSPEAVLARADGLVQEGDLEGALRELSRLPPRGRNAMGQWRADAQARVDVDRHVAAIRAAAVRDLTQTMAANP